MGERGAVIVREDEQQIVFYTHWNGYRLDSLVANGLRLAVGGGRDHRDPDYMRRILFDAICEEREPRNGTTGFGIGHKVPGDPM